MLSSITTYLGVRYKRFLLLRSPITARTRSRNSISKHLPWCEMQKISAQRRVSWDLQLIPIKLL